VGRREYIAKQYLDVTLFGIVASVLFDFPYYFSTVFRSKLLLEQSLLMQVEVGHYSITALFPAGPFDLRDTASNESKARRPFGLKKSLAGLVRFVLCVDPGIERFDPDQRFASLELCTSTWWSGFSQGFSFRVVSEFGHGISGFRCSAEGIPNVLFSTFKFLPCP